MAAARLQLLNLHVQALLEILTMSVSELSVPTLAISVCKEVVGHCTEVIAE